MKVGFIGGGKMAGAIIESVLRSRLVVAHEVFASDVSSERRRYLKKVHGINVYSHNRVIVASANIIFLCVKPQDMELALKDIESDFTPQHIVVSIAAGLNIARIRELITKARVIRVMPNLATLVSEGMSVYCVGSGITDSDKKAIEKLLQCFGKVLELPESNFDAVTALSGSGPAFWAYLLDVMVDAGVKEGLSRENALLLGEQTMQGTARLLIEKDIDPKDLVQSVSSAKGTTVEGVKILQSSTIDKILYKTIHAAAKRSKELSS